MENINFEIMHYFRTGLKNLDGTKNAMIIPACDLFMRFLENKKSLGGLTEQFDDLYYHAPQSEHAYFEEFMEKLSLTSSDSKNLNDPENQGLLITVDQLKMYMVEFMQKLYKEFSR